MEFATFRTKLKENFDIMASENKMLFEVDADKDALYDLYLNSFPAGTNELFRQRRVHDCSACRQFIKSIGLAVSLKDGVMKSIWDFETGDEVYQTVVDAMAKWVRSHEIKDVYLYERRRVGIESNKQLDENGKIWTWNHLYCDLPREYYVDRYAIACNQSRYRDRANVFYRSLEEITPEATETVLELIADGSLYRGDEWKEVLQQFHRYQMEYADVSYDKKLYAWEKSLTIGDVIGRIRNHSMGTLLTDLTNHREIDSAVRAYETIVAPHNYKRPKPVFTVKMLDEARKTVQELGYGNSLRRRFANLDDISVNNVLFANADAANRLIGGGDLFDELKKSAVINPQKYSGIGEIPVEKFINYVIPKASSIEVLFENRHQKNLVSVIAPVDKDAPGMFKWDNPFSWAYKGNIADSEIKENVRKAGGNVTGDVRFSIQWNDQERHDGNDLDAHCTEACEGIRKYEIYYPNKTIKSPNGGVLDVDIINPHVKVPAVENIVYERKSTMRPGKYTFYVNVYTNRGGVSGFKAEIEIDGHTYHYEHDDVHRRKNIIVAEIFVDRDHNITIEHRMTPIEQSISSTEIWNVKTSTFIPVTSVMYSPNYWDGNRVGNKHYIFTLDGCVNPDQPNGWYNEYLKEELVSKHRRVFEALGARAHVEDVHDQLSGLGFSSTQRADMIVRVTGKTQRLLRVKF